MRSNPFNPDLFRAGHPHVPPATNTLAIAQTNWPSAGQTGRSCAAVRPAEAPAAPGDAAVAQRRRSVPLRRLPRAKLERSAPARATILPAKSRRQAPDLGRVVARFCVATGLRAPHQETASTAQPPTLDMQCRRSAEVDSHRHPPVLRQRRQTEQDEAVGKTLCFDAANYPFAGEVCRGRCRPKKAMRRVGYPTLQFSRPPTNAANTMRAKARRQRDRSRRQPAAIPSG